MSAPAAKRVKTTDGKVKIGRALVSVFDKADIEVLGKGLGDLGVTVVSTGGTAKKLRETGLEVKDVSEVTNFPEMLGGRVKTLHPFIHGGLLANRADASHMQTLKDHAIEPIDLVVCNLYAFGKAVESGKPFEGCIEMIDIGGPTMVRAAAKNCDSVAIITDPSQYAAVLKELQENDGCLCKDTRRELAAAAFAHTARYDCAVAKYFAGQTGGAVTEMREYVEEFPLKYGVNPHQKPAALSHVGTHGMPFEVLNGAPGYTNLMDALNSWQLVSELESALGLPAAASFKHVSPAGAAVGVELSEELKQVYDVVGKDLSPQAVAYVRARNADPMSSFGDFIGISGIVDVSTASIIKREVADGVIAAGFEPEALEMLKAKKGGKFLVLKADKAFVPPVDEYKEVYGVALSQKRNDAVITPEHMTKDVVTKAQLTDDAVRDLVVATIAVKYTQSNSVCYALGGQVIGVGAGQQSRVDCVKLAGRKVATWHARRHPKVAGLKFKSTVKRTEKVNARVAYISDDMTAPERKLWEELFEEVPEMMTAEERAAWANELTGVALSSDAFFPFRDNIDQASKFGVKFIAQPGGSVQDKPVAAACDEYGMAMGLTGVRVFHH